MIRLSALTGQELDEVRGALWALDDALALLCDRHIVNEQEGIDLEELSEAAETELEQRGMEDAEYHVKQAVAVGALVEVVRPDGEKGYAPAG